MSINEIIIYIMVFFMVLAAIDKIIGYRYGLGKKFDEGFMMMGNLALAMIGVVSLAPVLARVLKPVVVPLYTALGADPAMFATTLLACDMGGYPLAMQLAATKEAGTFAGLILGTIMGPSIVFSIPVALGILEKEDLKYLATGVLAGMVAVPIGALAGGLAAGYSLSMIVSNLTPIIIVAFLLAAGLWKIPGRMIRGFTVFGRGVVILITMGTAVIIVETLTGLVVIPGMAPISDSLKIIGSIAIILCGALPMMHVVTKVFKKPLTKLGSLLGMNDIAAAGMVACLASNLPMLKLIKDMDPRGKVINIAFGVGAAVTFGSHLGFTAGINRDMIFPVITAKLTTGIVAVVIATFIAPKSSIVKMDKMDKFENSNI